MWGMDWRLFVAYEYLIIPAPFIEKIISTDLLLHLSNISYPYTCELVAVHKSCKSQSYFYTFLMNGWKSKLQKYVICNNFEKYKVLSNESEKTCIQKVQTVA